MNTHDDFTVVAHQFLEAIAPITTAEWAAPSLCSEWTRADVVDHIVTTQAGFLDRNDVAVVTAPAELSPAQRARVHLDSVIEVSAPIWDTEIDGFFGPSTIGQTLVEFYGFDLLLHRIDITWGTPNHRDLTAEQIAWMNTAMDGWGDMMYQPGMFEPAVAVPAGADAHTALLCRAGRVVTG